MSRDANFVDTNQHFSRIAKKYRDLRITDPEPIHYIKKKTQNLSKIEMLEVGCGTGRYSIELIRALRNKIHLHCIDANLEMVKQLHTFFTRNNIKKFNVSIASAENLPVKDNSVNFVITLNAIHHFKLLEFLNEASRILVDKGYLFIYTRLRSQNRKNIWGKYFPLFNQKETRLYELNELKATVKRCSNLFLKSTKLFKYKRYSNMNRLIYKAQNHHYSTFSLYTEKEFEQSLKKFKQNLKTNFEEQKNIKWTSEYSLLVIKKTM